MRVFKIAVALALVWGCPFAARADEAAPQTARAVFQLPTYPNTQPFNSYLGLESYHPPFANLMRVYKTKDGSALDLEKVIAFYQDALKAKGWKTGVADRWGNEPYLNLSAQVYEHAPDGTSIHATGNFQLWVAPKDGMFTISLHQWRISSLDHDSKEAAAKVVETVLGPEGAKLFRNDKLPNGREGGWEEWYQNEYLVNWVPMEIYDPAVKRKSDIDMRGILHVTLLTYRDARIAVAQAKQLLTMYDGTWIVVGKNLVVIDDPSMKQKDKMDALVARLQALAPQDTVLPEPNEFH